MKKIIYLITFLSFSVLNALQAQTTTNPDTVCFGSTAESYWVAPNAGSTFTWTIDPATGAVIVSGQNTNSIVVDWSGAAVGYYTNAITLTEMDNTTFCTGDVTLDVEVISLPAAPVANDVVICSGNTVPDLSSTGVNVVWYDDAALTNQVGTGNTFNTGQTAVGTYTYYVTQNVSGCEGPADTVSLTINQTPPAPIALSPADYCEGDVIADLTAADSLGGTITWYSDPALTTVLGTGTTYASGQTAGGVYNYYVTETLNGCEGPATNVALTIISAPSAAAGSDAVICEGDTYTLSGTASNNSAVSWTTAGDGTFSNASALNPVYTPGANDILNGTVSLALTAIGNAPCASDTDTMVLNITPAVIVGAGTDGAICEGDTYTLAGSASNNAGVLWTSTGDGVFSNAATLNPVYTPGAADIASGSVSLILTATGNNPCSNLSDTLDLTITPAPTVNAGVDTVICEGSTYLLAGAATNYSSTTWSTLGTGAFSNASALNAIYTPGAADIANGSVTLVLTAAGNGSCAAVIDTIVISITAAPTVDAGVDGAICEGDTYSLSGSATNYSTTTWTTSGDGTFSNANALNPVYTPGPNDIINGTVDLTLTVDGNPPCGSVVDVMTLTINPVPTPGPIQHN
jgi:hypothetical protein